MASIVCTIVQYTSQYTVRGRKEKTIVATELWSSTLYYLSFRKEKKRVEKELLSTFKDESIIVMADWLKVLMLYSDFSIYWMGVFPLLGFFSICGVSNLVPYSRRFFKISFYFFIDSDANPHLFKNLL